MQALGLLFCFSATLDQVVEDDHGSDFLRMAHQVRRHAGATHCRKYVRQLSSYT
ncbi:hypothetical protein SAMN05216236_15213 [Sedimentitalea nanhaiensis]|uniref:Uncharacterized protein n=1 Tax=Sedimentitalea nanhaiensis TaxID=999627 RepID=A0A1I7E9E3_9RHOB|nr:hypothetical protein SAMN05216236_15213 [Sedimentitalea nanhaiensis]